MSRAIVILMLLTSAAASGAGPSGERLAYLVGCINCHHQHPKEIINAPPLAIVQAYSLTEFKKLMKTGVTRTGRDMLAQSNLMGRNMKLARKPTPKLPCNSSIPQ